MRPVHGGVATADVTHRLGEGHIGLASHALRVEAAGGALTIAPAPATGTVATVELLVPGLDRQGAYVGAGAGT